MIRTIAVIGGGLGALSGAIRLARMGFRVQLFEKNPSLGGKMNESVAGPYRFDTGPSLLTMPFVIDELFRCAGFERASWLEFLPNEPLCRYFFADGSVLDASADQEKMRSALEGLCPADAGAFDRFMDYAQRIYEVGAEVFLFTPIHEFRQLASRRNLARLFRLHQIDPFRSVHRAVSRRFSDPRLVQLFDRYATYNGSSPFRAPATLNTIPYVEYHFGGYYIKGGMYRLVAALEKLAGDMGIEIHTSARTERILHDGKKATGIQVNGERVPADYVLCGADVVAAHNDLIDGFPRRRSRLSRLEPSLSGMVFLWGVRTQNPQLQMHNVLFSSDYRKEFEDLFLHIRAPADPTVYIAITSRADPQHAPPGCENWFVLLNMPYLTEEQDWRQETRRMREAIFRRLRRIGIEVSRAIEEETVLTPEDFHSLYGSNRGSIYGLSSNSTMSAFRRPPNRSRDLEGLYFASGSTHPGGGIPLVVLSGKIAAELIAESDKARRG